MSGGDRGSPEGTESLNVALTSIGMVKDRQNDAVSDLRHELQGVLNKHMQEVLTKLDAHRHSILAELRTFASRLQASEHEIADLPVNGGSNGTRMDHGPGMVEGMPRGFERFRAEMRQEIEIAFIKAGYLAVASSACDDLERQQVFQTLKAKEQALKNSAAHALVPYSTNDALSISTSRHIPASRNSPTGMSPSVTFATHSYFAAAGLSRDRDEIEQHFDFEIQLDRSNNKALGVTIDGDHDSGRSLLVETVKEGLVQDWNKTCLSDQVVQPGDVIVAVNGEQGDSTRMLTEAGTGRKLRLCVRRAGRAGGLPSRVPLQLLT